MAESQTTKREPPTRAEIAEELDWLYVSSTADYEDIGRFVCEYIEEIRSALWGEPET